jgi:hypothetical protein
LLRIMLKGTQADIVLALQWMLRFPETLRADVSSPNSDGHA